MANTLDDLMPKILAGALETLRGTTMGPQLVNSDYSDEAQEKGKEIEVPTPSAVSVIDVVPAATAPNPADRDESTVKVPLSYWREAPFYLTNKDIAEVMDGTVPMIMGEAVKSLAEDINKTIYIEAYKGTYNFVGTPGTTPFASSDAEARDARKLLNNARCLNRDRMLVLDTDADANAGGLDIFQRADASGSAETLETGRIGMKRNFSWYYDQDMPFHTAGTGTGYLVNQANVAVGDTTVIVDTGTGTIVEGDVFTVAGDSQTYVAKSFASNVVTFSPPAKTAFADNAAITIKGDHAINLAFQRNAIALAMRPPSNAMLQQLERELSMRTLTMTDPISGIPLKLTVRGEYERIRWGVSALWGTKPVRESCIVRIAG